MLGEDHSLVKEFPEHAKKIDSLNESDPGFAKDCQRYNSVDAEIRELELGSAPIGDAEMHELKHERRVLKDKLYSQLIAD